LRWDIGMSGVGRYCCRSRKSKNSKNLAKVDSSMFSLRQGLWDRYGGRWSIWCETMWSLTSPRAEHTSEPEKFHWSVKKDFFNTIEE